MASKKYCPDCDVTHTSLMCFNKPRRPLRKTGPVTRKWLATRHRWIEANPPDHSDYWYCSHCGCALTYDTLTLDHVWPRSKRPDLLTEMSNLQPLCYDCNQEKGSKSPDKYATFFR